MKNIFYFSLFLIIISCKTSKESKSDMELNSPNNVNQIKLSQNEAGELFYTVSHQGKKVIDLSQIANFDFQNQASFGKQLDIISTNIEQVTDDWEMQWGEQREVKNKYSLLTVLLREKEAPNRQLTVYFRAYDDGVAFRYEIPAWEGVDQLFITDESSNFQLTGDHTTWWIPGDWDIYEHLYNETKISEIDALSKRNHPNLAQTHIPENAVNTPVTMRTKDGLHLSFHEANLTNYPGMTLKVNTETFNLQSELVGSDRLNYKAKVKLPFQTPWRSIQIADRAGDLIESRLIVNLNEPNQLSDVSWFTPMKYIGIWWEMHLGKATWDYGMVKDDKGSWIDPGNSNGTHGATTENTKRYIDFAAENGFGGVLVEGWNTGWEHWIGFEDREGVFDFITPYPDYDLEEIAEYARQKGVQIIMHHETSAATETYDKQMEEAYQLMQKHGMHTVKTGYVGKILPKGEYHHGQYMVNHYRRALETAAKYKVAINAHEPIKATGIRRTLPNAISREGLRGQEFNAWASDGGNPPDHLPTVAFTRMLAGPIDFTPGVFNLKLNPYKKENQINTTLAQQLALYVVLYSPIQMACDLPENYENHPAFEFIKEVGVDWERSKVLGGEVGDFVIIAREERETGHWFVGGITDENARVAKVDFDFLPEDKSFKAILYKDTDDAHWNDNPTAINIKKIEVNKDSSIEVPMAAGGGFAISVIPLD